jgi:hypothetical protein
VVHKKRIIGKKERDKGSLTLQQSNMLNEKKCWNVGVTCLFKKATTLNVPWWDSIVEKFRFLHIFS